MQQHREEAQTAAVHRRTKASARPAHVQATLHREQVVYVLMCQLSFAKINRDPYVQIVPASQKPCFQSINMYGSSYSISCTRNNTVFIMMPNNRDFKIVFKHGIMLMDRFCFRYNIYSLPPLQQ